jgi:phage shock protein A
VQRELEENRRQLAQAEETYKNLLRARDVAVASARAKIESLKGAINAMRMKQAMAEMSEMAAGMVSEIGGSGDTLNRMHEMVEEERTRAAGRARVARDAIDMSQVNVKEAELEALADQALAEFAAKEGISLAPAGEAAPAPARTMGPAKAEEPGSKEG